MDREVPWPFEQMQQFLVHLEVSASNGDGAVGDSGRVVMNAGGSAEMLADQYRSRVTARLQWCVHTRVADGNGGVSGSVTMKSGSSNVGNGGSVALVLVKRQVVLEEASV